MAGGWPAVWPKTSPVSNAATAAATVHSLTRSSIMRVPSRETAPDVDVSPSLSAFRTAPFWKDAAAAYVGLSSARPAAMVRYEARRCVDFVGGVARLWQALRHRAPTPGSLSVSVRSKSRASLRPARRLRWAPSHTSRSLRMRCNCSTCQADGDWTKALRVTRGHCVLCAIRLNRPFATGMPNDVDVAARMPIAPVRLRPRVDRAVAHENPSP